ncbi:MAG: hydantoinase B/oxoprolinase family protein, partial [Solirubrobacteraceae bacterium]
MSTLPLDGQERITAEIIRNSLEVVSGELSAVVENTAMSPIFTMNHDYSCGVFYSDGADVVLVARSMSIPVHIFAALESVRTVVNRFRDEICPGDVFLVADPYMGGSHCPDWTIIKPVFLRDRPALFPCVRGHINDVGGPVPGGYNVRARDVWQEGFRISPLRLVQRGQRVTDLWNTVLANTRTPSEVGGDLAAMVGACGVGELRLLELAQRYGEEMLERSIAYILDYSERQLRDLVDSWPDGRYEHTALLDHDFAGNRDLPIKVTIDVCGSDVIVDFAGTSPQAEGFVNSPVANSVSQVLTAMTVLAPDVPVNSGFFRSVEVRLPEGSLVNPRAPAPVGHCTLCPGTTVIDAVTKAFEQVAPRLVGSGTNDLNSARCFGVDPRGPRYFVGSDITASPMSAGGAYGTDGWGAWASPFCALRLPSME